MGFVALLTVLARPHRTFRALMLRRPIVPVLTFSIAVSLLATIPLVRLTEARLAALDLPEEARATAAESLRSSRWIAVASAPVGGVVRLGLAALVLGTAALAAGVPITARGALVVAGYGLVPRYLGSLADSTAWTLGSVAPAPITGLTSLAGIVPETFSHGWIHAAASQIDLFSLATLVLWSIGLAVFAGERSRSGATAGVVAWALVTFVAVAATRVAEAMGRGTLPGG
ncbi:MAG: hypothetical protein KC591_12495 [Gemmatimonadetes bacterium]|nr:hypothetical protein [Gemmatimonadota bacterium]